jgi:hypothetical protein
MLLCFHADPFSQGSYPVIMRSNLENTSRCRIGIGYLPVLEIFRFLPEAWEELTCVDGCLWNGVRSCHLIPPLKQPKA